MAKIILVAETGADIAPELAKEYSIYIVPMHVTFGEETKDDGSFSPDDVVDYYNKTGKVPKTSGCNVGDFTKVFDEIHEQYPDHHILYMAYSAVTTCSYASAKIAAEDRDYVTHIDTKLVTVGQGFSVVRTAKLIKEHPEWTIEECVACAESVISKVHICFLPHNLDFLRAGGRVSNVAALCGNLLSLHPLINLQDGFLRAEKKYRGSFKKILPNLIKEYTERYSLKKDEIWMGFAPGFSDELKKISENAAKQLGYLVVKWFPVGGVITSHGGTGAVALTGMSED